MLQCSPDSIGTFFRRLDRGVDGDLRMKRGLVRIGNAGELWDRARLKAEQKPWIDLQAGGVGVHVGEWGAYNRTPHDVVLAWMADCLDLWKANNWGWSLWNLTGSFGVLDSERADVNYEMYKGHQFDRAMLELLRQG